MAIGSSLNTLDEPNGENRMTRCTSADSFVEHRLEYILRYVDNNCKIDIKKNQNDSSRTVSKFYRVPQMHERSNLNCVLFPIQNKYLSTKNVKKVSHCLFDLDGTILDSEIIYHRTIHKICQRYDKIYTKELQNQLYGVTDRQLSIGVVGELKLPISVEDFERQMTDLVHQNLSSAPFKDGAERLLWHLSDNKIPIALVTNSKEQAVQMHADARPKLFGLFHHKVCITDAELKRGKPHPDIYLLGAARFTPKAEPTECLAFEDSHVGVEAAVRANMQVVMIPDQRLDRELTLKATIVIKSLLDFKPQLFGLPAFKDRPTKVGD